MASANPAMNADVWGRATFAEGRSQTMTLQGTVSKTALLVVIMLVAAAFTWTKAMGEDLSLAYGLTIAGAIGGLILSLVTIFVPKVSPYTSPLYAGCEGLFLGAVSASFEQRMPGIVSQAIGLSMGVLLTMLTLYGTGLVRATEKFKTGVIAATGAIALVYLASFAMRFFGYSMPFIHDTGIYGIGFSLVVVVVAALNLILDFDFIEQGVRLEAPKYMEWYGGFSLLVTLVWMYLEILRLLAKIQGGNRN